MAYRPRQVLCVKVTHRGRDIPATMTDRNDGTYFVEYLPPTEGPYEVDVTLDGKPIKGSPYTVQMTELWSQVSIGRMAPKAITI